MQWLFLAYGSETNRKYCKALINISSFHSVVNHPIASKLDVRLLTAMNTVIYISSSGNP